MRSPGATKPGETSGESGSSKSSRAEAASAKSTLAPGTLVVVATPIGNLGDMTLRAADSLRAANVIACEDTRVTAKLLSAYDIHTPMLAYHEHNAARVRPFLIQRLQKGEIVALVSDAGTPLVSDPGYKLVEAVIEAGLSITATPGSSALLTALVLSGLPPDRFLFAGFLPPRSAARRREIAELAAVPATLIFYEGPSRLADVLADLTMVLGPRPAAVARELTKKFEEVRRAPLDELAASYASSPAPRGEIVIVVGPPGHTSEPEDAAARLDTALETALATHSVREAATLVAAETGLPRRVVYARALALRKPDQPV